MNDPTINTPTRTARTPTLLCVLLLFALQSRSVRASEPDVAGPSQQAIQQLFQSGNEKFRAGLELQKSDRAAAEGKFREAAGAWRAVAQAGKIRNVKLETNIANASLFAGDVPAAILAYRRALAIDPTDRDVLAGLTMARKSAGTEALALGQVMQKSEAAANTGGLRGTLSGIGRAVRTATGVVTGVLSTRMLLAAGSVAYVLFFGLLCLRVLGRWRVPLSLLTAVAIVCIASVTPLIVRESAERRGTEAVVIAPNTVARNGPAELYDPAFQEPLRAGLEVSVEERRGGWAKILLRDGRTAWIRTDALEWVTPASTG